MRALSSFLPSPFENECVNITHSSLSGTVVANVNQLFVDT